MDGKATRVSTTVNSCQNVLDGSVCVYIMPGKAGVWECSDGTEVTTRM